MVAHPEEHYRPQKNQDTKEGIMDIGHVDYFESTGEASQQTIELMHQGVRWIRERSHFAFGRMVSIGG